MAPRTMFRFCQTVLPQYQWEEKVQEPLDQHESRFTHKSDAQELISAIPVIEVDGSVARCTGVHEYGYGHPVHYIQLDTKDMSRPVICKWCGLRYKKRGY